jgi:uncharacterized membrane protein YgaE (UPF0421/DUF939 family)
MTATDPQNATSRLYVLRTAVAATVSLLVARLVRLPEPYWATVSTMVVVQSSLVASWGVSWRRLAGTALGAFVGGALGSFLEPSVWLFGAALAAIGFVCRAVHLDRAAYRFAGITLAIVMLIPRHLPAWLMASHRCAEVSLGIAVGLAVTAVWREREGE